MPGFDEIMSHLTGSDAGTADVDENNSLETLDTDDSQGFDGDDEGGEVDNSTETGQEIAFDPSLLTDPQLQAAYRQMQAAFTPKLQDAARVQQQYGDLDEGVVAAVREYQQLLRTDPYQARQFLAQQPADPFEGVEPLTDTEAALLNVAKQMWADNQQFKLQSQQSQFQAQQEARERTFSQLETQFKTKIPLEDKQRVQQMCQQTGCQDVGLMWKALNFEKAEQRGADKASRVAQKKQKAPTPPTNRQQRSAPPQPSGRKGLDGHFEDAWNQHNPR